MVVKRRKQYGAVKTRRLPVPPRKLDGCRCLSLSGDTAQQRHRAGVEYSIQGQHRIVSSYETGNGRLRKLDVNPGIVANLLFRQDFQRQLNP